MSTFSEYQERVAAGEATEQGVSVPREARPYQGHRAGFATRMVSAIIDVLAVTAIIVLANVSIAFVVMVVNSASGPDLPKLTLSAVAGTLLLWLAWTVGWATNGRTLGMHIMGIRVVNHAGERVRWPVAAVRAAFCIVFPVGLAWAIISRANRSVQDVVLRTSVVHDWVVTLADDSPAMRTLL